MKAYRGGEGDALCILNLGAISWSVPRSGLFVHWEMSRCLVDRRLDATERPRPFLQCCGYLTVPLVA